jgi:hypothetical protein
MVDRNLRVDSWTALNDGGSSSNARLSILFFIILQCENAVGLMSKIVVCLSGYVRLGKTWIHLQRFLLLA